MNEGFVSIIIFFLSAWSFQSLVLVLYVLYRWADSQWVVEPLLKSPKILDMTDQQIDDLFPRLRRKSHIVLLLKILEGAGRKMEMDRLIVNLSRKSG